MSVPRTGDVISGGKGLNGRPDRLSLIKQLKSEGYESAEIIASVLKERHEIEVSERTVFRDLQILYEDNRYILDSMLKDGGYIMEFHDTLLELKAIKSRCKEANIRAQANHDKREKEIKVLMAALNGEKPHTESMYQSMLLQNDSNLESTIQANEKIIQSTTKDFLSIQGKTELMKAFDDFVVKNKPQPVDMPELEIPQLVKNAKEENKKEDPNE